MKQLLRKGFAFFLAHSRWLNIGLVAVAGCANQVNQVFCQPVAWAGWVLGLSVGAFLGWPWLRGAPLGVRYGALALQGVAGVVCVYCAFFLWRTLPASLLLFWLVQPALGLLPYLFGWQLLRRVRETDLSGGAVVFGLGALALLPPQLWVAGRYQTIGHTANELRLKQELSVATLAEVLPQDYVTERVVGLYFRYHTEVNFYDGWRPPLHDPFLNVCYQVAGDPLRIPFAARVALYRRLFPELPVKSDCSCAPYNSNAATYERFGSANPRTDDDRAAQPGFRWPADSVLE